MRKRFYFAYNKYVPPYEHELVSELVDSLTQEINREIISELIALGNYENSEDDEEAQNTKPL